MSLFVQWQNAMKLQATRDWLTADQRPAFESLTQKWAAHRHVALVGASGCGKSFIARLLHRECGYAYAHEIGDVPPGTALAVVDANEYNRLWRPVADELQIGRIVWTLRTPPSDPMPIASVVLSEADRSQFQNNLYRAGIITGWETKPEGLDFGLILRLEAIARAETLPLTDETRDATSALAADRAEVTTIGADEDDLDTLF